MKKNIFILIMASAIFMILPFKVNAFVLPVKTPDKEFTLEVESSDEIEAVKKEIEEYTNISYKKQILHYGEQKLENGRTLYDYEINGTRAIEVSLKKELNKVDFYIDDPQKGNIPDIKTKLVMSNEDTILELDDIELKWYEIDGDTEKLLDDDKVFVQGKKYKFDITSTSSEKVFDYLEEKNCIVSDNINVFYNGQKIYEPDYFYIGAIESINIEANNFFVGQPLPKNISIIIKAEDNNLEYILDVKHWEEILANSEIQLDETAVIEKGKKYNIVLDESETDKIPEEILIIDCRTKVYINGKEEIYFTANDGYTVIFDANGGKFGDNKTHTIDKWNVTLYDSLPIPIRAGYKFKGYYTEKTNGTKFEMILNESGIDSNMTFYAQWEEEVKIPNTLDDISKSIIMVIASAIALIAMTIYLIRKKKIKA